MTDYKAHIGKLATIYLRDKTEIVAIILGEKDGRLDIKLLGSNFQALSELETTMVKGIYSEPLII